MLFDVGLTIKFEPVAPVFQAYVDAPLAVNVPVEPAQMVAELADTVGNALTVTLPTAVFVQPVDEMPVTVYEVFVVGLTEIVDVVAPVFQEYVDAPLAVNTAEFPAQVVEDVEATIGNALTVTLPTAVFLQPVVAVPVTV